MNNRVVEYYSRETSNINTPALNKNAKKLSPSKQSVKAAKEREAQQREREKEIVGYFIGPVSAEKRTPALIKVMISRLKSHRIATFDYSDEYSREWFLSTYNLSKAVKLKYMNITGDDVLKRMKKKYNKVIAEKIVDSINVLGAEHVNYTSYLANVRSALVKSQRDVLKFCFNLFDHDGNGLICPNDIDVFNTLYTGTCCLLSTDFIALANMFSFKKKYPAYQLHLTSFP